MDDRLEMFVQGPLNTLCTFGEAVVYVIHREVTLEALRATVVACNKVAARYPGKVVSLTIVDMGIKLPSAALRKTSAEVMAETKQQTSCAAYVFSGDGFFLSAVRSVLTAIELLRPYDLPRRSFGELKPATMWLGSRIGRDAIWAQQLNSTITHLLRPDTASAAHTP